MTKIFSYLLSCAIVICIFSCQSTQDLTTQRLPEKQIENKLDKKTRADLAIAQNVEMTKDPELGYVPRERLWQASKQMQALEARKGKAAITGITWSERGPDNVGGRTRTIMFDPNDTDNKKVFAASVSGGLWVTDDIYASTPTWTAVNDFFDNMAITTMAHDPIDTDTMFFGTGEGFFNADAVRGDGIFRSLDGGDSWTQLATTASGNTFNYVQKIAVDDNGYVYAATRDGGVQKSTDHGATWSTALSNTVPSTGTNATTNRAADLEIAANGDLYVAMGIFGTDGIYKSTDEGLTWTRVYSSSGEQRIEIACAPGNSSYVYAVTQSTSSYAALNFLRTTNGGTSWTTLSPPTGLASTQAWYDLSLAVDPNDETDLYIGGLNMWKSTNSGTSFTQVSIWYNSASYPYVHADQHTVVYAPGSSDSILFGNDGGVFLTENGTSLTPSFSHQVNDYNTTQFYSCAINPTAGSDNFLAGSQDNGSHLYNAPGINSTTEVTGGDGAYVHIDQDDPSYQFTSYVYNQYRRTTNNWASYTTVNFSGSSGKFINPTDYDNDEQIMYCSDNAGTFRRWTNPRTGSTSAVVTFATSAAGEPSAVFCDPNTSHRVYLGTDAGEVWQIDNANATITATDITPTGMSGYVSSIDVENGDADHILATVSSYGAASVWESTDGGTNWTNIEGDLPDMPIRWGMFNPMGSDSVFLATELGVWTTDNINGTSTSWGPSNTGLANVRTDMLQWRNSDSTLIASTHGRGLFSTSFSEIVDVDFAADKTYVFPCESVSFNDLSLGATSWEWDFNDDGVIDATTQNPSHSYNKSGSYSVKLIINGSDSITKTAYISVAPKLGTPYTTSDGGDFESNTWHFGSASLSGATDIWELGAPGNAINTTSSGSNVWKTDLDDDITVGDYSCALLTPSFNMSAAGTYTLSFDYRMEAQYSNAPFGVHVESSTDGGSTWSALGTYNPTNNWYSTSSHSVVGTGNAWSHTVGTYLTASQDVSALAGNDDVRFRIIFEAETGWGGGYDRDGFSVDDFELAGPSNDPAPWEIETLLNASATEELGPNDTVDFISSDCKIIATIINLSTHDYGSTTVTIDNAGNSTMDFDTNTVASKEICEKTILITPTTNNTSGAVKIITYYTNTEASAWSTNTNWNYDLINQIKAPGAITSATIPNTIYGSSPDIDSTYGGNNLKIEASYTNGFSGVGAGRDGGTGPLPLTLIQFAGEWSGNDAQLSWVTALEVNVDYFDIERMNGNIFEKVGQIKANGNTTTMSNYSFTHRDSRLETKDYVHYRLKMVDIDGSYKYSPLVTLRHHHIFTVSPNPVRDFVNINFDELKTDDIHVIINDVNGREVIRYDYVQNGDKLDLSGTRSGIYFITILNGNAVIETKKIQIVN